MATMQQKVIGLLEEKAQALGYEAVKVPGWANTGEIHLEKPGAFGQIATIDYNFQSGYFTLRLSVNGRLLPSQPGRADYFDWHVEHGNAKDQKLFEDFLSKLEASVPQLASPKKAAPKPRKVAAHPLAAELDSLLTGLTGRGDLAGYAAHDGLKTVVENWKAALQGGHDLATLVGDIEDVVKRINEFGEAVKGLDQRPAGPRRR